MKFFYTIFEINSFFNSDFIAKNPPVYIFCLTRLYKLLVYTNYYKIPKKFPTIKLTRSLNKL